MTPHLCAACFIDSDAEDLEALIVKPERCKAPGHPKTDKLQLTLEQ